jgi:hypothetical protein
MNSYFLYLLQPDKVREKKICNVYRLNKNESYMNLEIRFPLSQEGDLVFQSDDVFLKTQRGFVIAIIGILSVYQPSNIHPYFYSYIGCRPITISRNDRDKLSSCKLELKSYTSSVGKGRTEYRFFVQNFKIGKTKYNLKINLRKHKPGDVSFLSRLEKKIKNKEPCFILNPNSYQDRYKKNLSIQY